MFGSVISRLFKLKPFLSTRTTKLADLISSAALDRLERTRSLVKDSTGYEWGPYRRHWHRRP